MAKGIEAQLMKNSRRFSPIPFSPADFIVSAIAIFTLFVITHLLGWRDTTTILTGTFPAGSPKTVTVLKAFTYMGAYFGTVLACPILLIAAVFSFLWERTAKTSNPNTDKSGTVLRKPLP